MRNAFVLAGVFMIVVLGLFACGGGSSNNQIGSPTYSISGNITDSSNAGIAGIIVSLSTSPVAAIATASDGGYSFTGVANGTYTLTPSKTGYTFSPASMSVTVSGADAAAQNFLATAAFEVAPNQTLSTAPHLFDVYRSKTPDKAVIFLHGGGQDKHHLAYELGINYQDSDLTDINANYDSVNAQLLLDERMIAVFPQGQAIAGAPNAFTWRNWVMNSGQDDVQFIRDLVAYIQMHYQVSTFYIAGYSNGGMMVNRLWCEAPELFEGYVAIAGPPSEHYLDPGTLCAPSTVKPYRGVVGSNDDVLQNIGKWEAQTWTINPTVVAQAQKAFVDPVVIGERYFFPDRVSQKCGETVNGGDADAVISGPLATWSFCSDSIQLIRVDSAGHRLQELESVSGISILDFILNFTHF